MPNAMKPRTCSRCGTAAVIEACPTCTIEWENRRAADEMTVDERLAEFRSWGPILEIDFAKMHERFEELVGRPVWTHELAKPELLEHEIATGTRPTMEGVLAKFPDGKPIVCVDMGGDPS